ncbi:MAG: hypothetical protein HY356_08385 [Gammaproteobacteria bacterium]|nr:hypothetical protein [Gammaproteobacteria bacterium]
MTINLSLIEKKKLRKLLHRCDSLARAVIQLQHIYADEKTSEDQCSFLETIIGAGIWYIDSKGVSTNKISVGVLKDFHPDSGINKPKYTEDHEYPRKIAARDMLQQDWSHVKDLDLEVFELYINKYGRVNFVTSTENKRITKH